MFIHMLDAQLCSHIPRVEGFVHFGGVVEK